MGGAILTLVRWVELFSHFGKVSGAILTGGWSYSHFGRVGGTILTLVGWVEIFSLW